MDKFSIYELLSFIVPGFVAAKITEYYLNLYHLKIPLPMDGNLEDNLLLLIVSIVLGLAIHVLTFRMMPYVWFKASVYPHEKEYIKKSKGKELPMIMPFVTQFYVNDKLHEDKAEKITIPEGKVTKQIIDRKETTGKTNDIQDYYEWTFDYAYYYLEVKDKLTQAKNFQSFYFMFRNLFSISIVHFLILGILLLVSFFGKPEDSFWNKNTLWMIIFLVVITWLITVIAKFMRGKMIDRVFWSYYVDRQINKIDNQNKKQ